MLLTVYLFTAALPTYMKLRQYDDVREGDFAKIDKAAEPLLRQISVNTKSG